MRIYKSKETQQKAPRKMNKLTTKTKKITCPKCDGKGVIKGLEHWDGGICYMCEGEGEFTPKPHTNQRESMEWVEKLIDFEKLTFTKKPIALVKYIPRKNSTNDVLGDIVIVTVTEKNHIPVYKSTAPELRKLWKKLKDTGLCMRVDPPKEVERFYDDDDDENEN